MNNELFKKESEIFSFSSLKKYTFGKRLTIRIVDLLIYSLISLVGKTVRFEPIQGWKSLDIEGWESWKESLKRLNPATMAFWHDNIFLTTYYWRNFEAAVLVSKSFDGEYISRTAQRFGYGVIRGSSSRGGAAALSKMIDLSRRGIRIVFTVDGPRGPRHKAKKGVLLVASRSGVPVVPMIAVAKHQWVLNNWDRTQIPWPFTKAKVFVGKPVFVAENTDESALEEKRLELERKLDELVSIGEEWRKS